MDAWTEAIDGCLMMLAAGGATAGTVRLRRCYLRRLAVIVPDPWTATTGDLLRFVGQPGVWSPETRKSVRATVRCLYRYGLAVGAITVDPSANLPSVKVPRALPRPAPLAVLHDALARADTRSRLMLLFAALAGLRRGEIAGLHSDMIHTDILRVPGKGGVVRKVPLCPAIMDMVRALPRGYLFPGKIDGHLSPNRVGVILSELLEGQWTAHTLRHQLAGRFHAVNGDILASTRLFGWAKPETAMVYTDVPIGALRDALFAAVG